MWQGRGCGGKSWKVTTAQPRVVEMKNRVTKKDIAGGSKGTGRGSWKGNNRETPAQGPYVQGWKTRSGWGARRCQPQQELCRQESDKGESYLPQGKKNDCARLGTRQSGKSQFFDSLGKKATWKKPVLGRLDTHLLETKRRSLGDGRSDGVGPSRKVLMKFVTTGERIGVTLEVGRGRACLRDMVYNQKRRKEAKGVGRTLRFGKGKRTALLPRGWRKVITTHAEELSAAYQATKTRGHQEDSVYPFMHWRRGAVSRSRRKRTLKGGNRRPCFAARG